MIWKSFKQNNLPTNSFCVPFQEEFIPTATQRSLPAEQPCGSPGAKHARAQTVQQFSRQTIEVNLLFSRDCEGEALNSHDSQVYQGKRAILSVILSLFSPLWMLLAASVLFHRMLIGRQTVAARSRCEVTQGLVTGGRESRAGHTREIAI